MPIEVGKNCRGECSVSSHEVLDCTNCSLLLTCLCCPFREDDGDNLHGCNVLAELVRPWANTDRVVCADSYFASVQAALRLKAMGLRFIGTVKTATTGFPMQYFQRVLLPGGKGDFKALLSTDEESGTTLLAYVWADRDRRYFIATCSSTSAGRMISRKRWRQRDQTPNAEPVQEDILIDQPEAGEVYYGGCGKIDEHNRIRQEYIDLEKKLRTMKWNNRANQTLFSMCVVDAFKLRNGCQGMNAGGARGFIENLASDLIDNDLDKRTLRRRREEAIAHEAALCGEDMPELDTTKHLTAPTPTKKRKTKNTNHRAQGRCMLCKKQTSHVCRACQCFKNGNTDKQYWICNKPGKVCMGKHLLQSHTECISS